jgi:hypothetical protein
LQVETNVLGTISVPIVRVVMSQPMMGTETVPETSVSTCNQLMLLRAREDFIEFSRRKSFKLNTNTLMDKVISVLYAILPLHLFC